jgi:phosphoglycolate phosphatase
VSRSRFGLVVFDLDGTLVDSRRDLAEAANAVLEHYGCQPHSEEAIGRMVGDGAATLVRRAFEHAGCPQPAEALSLFLTIYNGRLLQCTRPYDGIIDLLTALVPRTTLAVCTNKPLESTRTILEELNLAGYFGPRVVGGDGPQPRKPDPAGLRFLMAAAGVLPDATILIGDSIIDWHTAVAASTHVCMAAYGFGFEGFPHERLRIGDQTVTHPCELAEVLY